MITRLHKVLQTQMERTAEDPSEEAVHDLRVAVRRLSEALRLFDGPRRTRKQLRRIRDRAAAVRDRDVALRLLRRPQSHPAVCYLQGQRDLAAAQLSLYLKRQLEPPPEQGTPGPLLPRVEAFLSASPAQPHALRIAAKHLRYAIEILDPAGAEPWLRRLRLLQRQLGDLHDLQVTAGLLSPLPYAHPIAKQLEARAAIREAQFQKRWPRHFGPRTRQQFLAWAKAAS